MDAMVVVVGDMDVGSWWLQVVNGGGWWWQVVVVGDKCW